MSPSSSLLLLAKTIMHPAARSLCDSWASCLYLGSLEVSRGYCRYAPWQTWTFVLGSHRVWCHHYTVFGKKITRPSLSTLIRLFQVLLLSVLIYAAHKPIKSGAFLHETPLTDPRHPMVPEAAQCQRKYSFICQSLFSLAVQLSDLQIDFRTCSFSKCKSNFWISRCCFTKRIGYGSVKTEPKKFIFEFCQRSHPPPV